MHVAVTGAGGPIGQALIPELRARGHRVTRLVRRPPRAPSEAAWDPAGGRLDPAVLEGTDAVVHLAAEGIAIRPWTPARKRRFLESRTFGTRLVAETLARLRDDGRAAPGVLVSASGVNYYGERGDVPVTERTPAGSGFMAGVAQAWEAAAGPAREAGVRVVHPRIGIVQTRQGGPLPRVLPLHRLGLGGRFGSGRQYWAWVDLADVVGIICHALVAGDLEGPVNVTAPEPVTNGAYTATLARVLRRPAVLPVPRLGPALLLGRELAGDLLFTSIRAVPERALASGYTFRQPSLEACLRELLGRP